MQYSFRTIVILAAILALGGFSHAFGAEPASEPSKSGLRRWAEQDYMLGDWGGLRTDLSKRGIDFEFFYAGAVPINLRGGIKRGAVYEGLGAMMVDLDSQRLAGYPGGHLRVSATEIHGERFSPQYVGDLNQVSLIDLPRGFRLWELYYEQKVWKDRVGLKVGQLVVDSDFAFSEYAQNFNFVNQTWRFPTIAFDLFDQPGIPKGHHGLPSTPFGVPGARLRLEPVPQFYLQAAVYDGKPDQSSSFSRINLNSEEGALAYFELGYKLNQGKDDTGLPGTYRLGGYYHTDDFYDYGSVIDNLPADLFPGVVPASPLKTHTGNYGAYFIADQMLYREDDLTDPAKQGLGAFLRGGVAPADRNLASWSLDGGLVYRGLIPNRDWDSLGVAASYLGISRDVRHAQARVNRFFDQQFGLSRFPFENLADYEAFVELSYKAQLTAWWTLQPSVQWVMHPGGSRDRDDALVFILLSTLRF